MLQAPMSSQLPRYATISQWKQLSSMSRTTVYEALGRGDLRAKKIGARTVIDVESGLKWLKSLPDAKIRAPRPAR